MDVSKELHWTEPLWKELHAIAKDHEALELKLSPVPIHSIQSEKSKSRKLPSVDCHALDDFNTELFPETVFLQNRLTTDVAVQSEKAVVNGVQKKKIITPMNRYQQNARTSSESIKKRKQSIDKVSTMQKPIRLTNKIDRTNDLKDHTFRQIIDETPLHKVMVGSGRDQTIKRSPETQIKESSDQTTTFIQGNVMMDLPDCSSFLCSNLSDIPSNSFSSDLVDDDNYSLQSSSASPYSTNIRLQYEEKNKFDGVRNTSSFMREICIVEKPSDDVICSRNVGPKGFNPQGYMSNLENDLESYFMKPPTFHSKYIDAIKNDNAKCRETLTTTGLLLSKEK